MTKIEIKIEKMERGKKLVVVNGASTAIARYISRGVWKVVFQDDVIWVEKAVNLESEIRDYLTGEVNENAPMSEPMANRFLDGVDCFTVAQVVKMLSAVIEPTYSNGVLTWKFEDGSEISRTPSGLVAFAW